MHLQENGLVHLRSAGVSLVLDESGPVPRVLHWGADLGTLSTEALEGLRLAAALPSLNNAPDLPRIFSLWPTEAETWAGTPAQSGHRGGTATTPRPALYASEVSSDPRGGGRALYLLRDHGTKLEHSIAVSLDPFGVVAIDLTITSIADVATAPYELANLTAFLPVPSRASEVLDFTGKWCRERSPQRHPLTMGTHQRTSRRGKPGHDASFLTVLGTESFGSRTGEVWALHTAWSGETTTLVEFLPEGAGPAGAALGGGEHIRPGEILLGPGESYTAPRVLFSWSASGLDGVSTRIHNRLRDRAGHPRTPRPVILNTWEAVYFDHDMNRLRPLVDIAARIGVERVVLDDGWFSGRRGDTAGLGDWEVDGTIWPEGLRPLTELIHAHGMEFGLWFEPEMINPDSELARTHPDWILSPAQPGPTMRNQYALNIAHPPAYTYLLERISALVSEYDIAYIKWDHNRDLFEAVDRTGPVETPAVHRQTVALYKLLAELRDRHPGLEIESCSGGGGRVDLGILEHTDRFWPSDCNDPVERARIERWTRALVPPELIGSHLGDERSHTTGRHTPDHTRMITALFGHAGVEGDLTRMTQDTVDAIERWIATYKELRELLHSGTVVNADLPDDSAQFHGVVSPDGSHAVFAWSRWETTARTHLGRVLVPGLRSDATYRVTVREDLGAAHRHQTQDPEWLIHALSEGAKVHGSVLTHSGISLPTLNPQQAMLLEFILVEE